MNFSIFDVDFNAVRVTKPLEAIKAPLKVFNMQRSSAYWIYGIRVPLRRTPSWESEEGRSEMKRLKRIGEMGVALRHPYV